MKITFVSFYQPQESMAASVRLRRMVEYFSDEGWQVEVVAPRKALPTTRGGLLQKVSKAATFFSQLADVGARALKSDADAFFITAPPLSMMIPAAFIRLRTRKPVVFEERDLLTINPLISYALVRKNFVSQAFEGWLLKSVNAVVTTTPALKKELEVRWPELARKNPSTTVVYNGFWKKDYEFLKNTSAPVRQGPLKVIHTGNFYGSRNPRPLLEALGIVKREHPEIDLAASFRFVFMGLFATSAEKTDFLAAANDLGLAPLFELRELKPHREALQEVNSSDVALLITHAGGSEWAIPAKLFEYIAVGRPIIAITHDRMVVDAVTSHDLGWCVPHEEPEALAKILLEMAVNPEKLRSRQFAGIKLAAFDAEAELIKLHALISGLCRRND